MKYKLLAALATLLFLSVIGGLCYLIFTNERFAEYFVMGMVGLIACICIGGLLKFTWEVFYDIINPER